MIASQSKPRAMISVGREMLESMPSLRLRFGVTLSQLGRKAKIINITTFRAEEIEKKSWTRALP